MTWTDKINQVWQGDCLELMKEMPDEIIDLTVTSPPYDNLRDYKGYTFDFESIAKELFRATKQGGVVVWVVGDATVNGSESGTSFRQALYFKEIGFNLHDTMIYRSHKPPLTHNRYEQKFEYMFILSKGRPKTFNPLYEPCSLAGKIHTRHGFRQSDNKLTERHKMSPTADTKIKGNIWFFDTGFNKSTNDKVAFEHPAIYPDQLAEDHILSWSNEGDLVYDPMAGSGTTLKMAKLLNRNYIGSEISSEYCEIIKKRLSQQVLI